MLQAPASSAAEAHRQQDRDRRRLQAKHRGRGDDDRDQPPAKDQKSEPIPDLVNIRVASLARVEILDGDDATVLAGDAIQYVNLPREAKWIAGPVGNLDRLGAMLRVSIRFTAPGVHRFWARLCAAGGNAVYTGQELDRPAFTCDLTEHEYQTGADGTLLIDQVFRLPAAGGNRFWIAARDESGTQQSSHRVQTRRLLFCQELVMLDATAAPNLTGAIATFAAQHITLLPLARAPLPLMPNVNVEAAAEEAALLGAMNTVFAASAGAQKVPFVFVIAYVNNLAVKKQLKFARNVQVGPGQPPVQFDVKRGNVPRYLWNAIDETDWRGAVEFEPADAAIQNVTDQTIVTGVPNDHHYPNQCQRVRLDVSGIGATPATGKLSLVFSIVEKQLGGVSFGIGTPLICLATRAGWINVPPLKQQAIVVHEIGHKIGMVPDGTGMLARLDQQYDGNGHTGSHCHAGVQAGFGPHDLGTCVMFGESLAPNQTFCVACANAVRKADLSTGWTMP